jgi:hypothetical protein
MREPRIAPFLLTAAGREQILAGTQAARLVSCALDRGEPLRILRAMPPVFVKISVDRTADDLR